ncbi:phosphatase PAP2 family protein [Vibrio sp. CAIM 722]|uniref:Phosphatase PAP2 family protein n=1 Tax=Vibrio eleionomae TaxID=2653505 RepID=A0A7X4RWW1_9VIBR|nr:phosphatase PAP2 family protein [Vibrio eleionomae]MZI96158.1 phosphatase PAP2 family protein [Vibrio eleionomae]
MLRIHNPFALTLPIVASAVLTACYDQNTTYSNPGVPAGVSYEQTVAEPTLTGNELTIVDNLATNNIADSTGFSEDTNPMLQILSGFDDIYLMGQSDWEDGTSATNSTSEIFSVVNFSNARILNDTVWQENYDYVATLTEPGETSPDLDRTSPSVLVHAYLDDQREKGFSITSGLGPLANIYRNAANSTSPYSINDADEGTIDVQTDASTSYTIDIDSGTLWDSDQGYGSLATNYGTYGSEENGDLGYLVDLLDVIKNYGVSTEPAKYHFLSPRPWRINTSYGILDFTDGGTSDSSVDSDSVAVDTAFADSTLYAPTCVGADDTTETTKYYETTDPDTGSGDTALLHPITALICAGRQIYASDGANNKEYSEAMDDGLSISAYYSSRAKDGAFPSGHTAEAFDRGLGLAYAIPSRFSQMVARSADLGENRIVVGMHSPLDVIGGRIFGTAATAAVLYNNADAAALALNQANSYFEEKASDAGFESIIDFANCVQEDTCDDSEYSDDYSDHDAIKETYKKYMTYGFTKLDETSADPEVPKGAEVLLKSRQPYLTAAQRRAVLATTEIDSNYPVINESRGWGRINLVDAADGYGAFNGDVNVDMDASDGGFSQYDRWRNDISGVGRLKKSGTGTLSLEGNNSYTGGTYLTEGELVAASQTAFGTYTVYQNAGTLTVAIEKGASDSSHGTLSVSDYVQEAGSLSLNLADNAKISADNGIFIDGGLLSLTVPALNYATTYTIMSAGGIYGTYDTDNVTVVDTEGNSDYSVSVNYNDSTVRVTITPDSGTL